MRRLLVVFLLTLLSGVAASGQAVRLADVLAGANQVIGEPPTKFTTPFLVVSVAPILGNECNLTVATYGFLYSVSAARRYGQCDHLPALHGLVWGRIWHNSVAQALNVPDSLELVYAEGHKPKYAVYQIDSASAIDSTWGQ